MAVIYSFPVASSTLFLDVDDPAKFFSGTLSAMSAMLQLEVPHLNVMTKMDLVPEHQREELDK